MIELPCKFHDYEILMIEIDTGIYECPLRDCRAIAIVREDPFWSTMEDGVSWEVEWISEPVRLKEVL